MILLLQVAIVLAVARVARWLVVPLGQPPVIGEMVAGLLLGPSLFGWLMPGSSAALFAAPSLPALNALSQLGLVLFMLSDDLMRVIREVHAGQRALLPEIQVRLDERATRPSLTPREVQVTELVGRGLRNKEIASELRISEETVQVHVKSILTKLGVNDRTAAVNVAM